MKKVNERKLLTGKSVTETDAEKIKILAKIKNITWDEASDIDYKNIENIKQIILKNRGNK